MAETKTIGEAHPGSGPKVALTDDQKDIIKGAVFGTVDGVMACVIASVLTGKRPEDVHAALMRAAEDLAQKTIDGLVTGRTKAEQHAYLQAESDALEPGVRARAAARGDQAFADTILGPAPRGRGGLLN